MKRFIAMLGSAMLVAAVAPGGLTAQAMTNRATNGPTIESARAGIAAPAAEALSADESAAAEAPAGQSATLMIVGGAALLAGLLIGGGAGAAIAVGGAILGLYGLWMYVR